MTPEQVKKLTDTELRIKVAELCGWKYEGHGMWLSPDGSSRQALYPTGGVGEVIVGMDKYDGEVPYNYPHDLNAMHEAERMVLRDGVWGHLTERYYVALKDICLSPQVPACFHATARQRAEAFVLTMERVGGR